MVCVGKDLRDYLIPTSLLWTECPPTIQSGLNNSREGASTASLDSLFLTTLWGKSCSQASNLSLHSFSFKPFPFILSLPDSAKKSLFLLFINCHQVECERLSPFKTKKDHLPQPFFTREEDPVLGLVEPQQILMSLVKPIQVPPDGNPSFYCIN